MTGVQARTIGGRYVLHDELASGGMATVHLGTLIGAVGFSRSVAIKRLHPQFAKEDDFVAMFIDEARIAARIRHPNVVATLDTISADGELFLVMELVVGESLSRLVRATTGMPVEIAVAIVAGALHGLHAAHEATDERGQWLEIVHRDVSPQNVLVGLDGVPRVLDFGVAKALGRLQTTRDGQIKGKVAYMAPEQLRGARVDRRTDVYAAAVVLWEALARRRLFTSDSPAEVMARVLEQPVEPPSRYASHISAALDEIVMRGLDRTPNRRFATAQEMALALEQVVTLPSQNTIARWVTEAGGEHISERARLIARVEGDSQRDPPSVATSPSPVTSQVVTIPDVGARSRSQRVPRSWILGAATVLVVAAGGVTMRACMHENGPTAASPASGAPASPTGSAAVVERTPQAAPLGSANSAQAAATTMSATTATATGSAGGTTKPSGLKKRPPSGNMSKKKVNCTPPYTVDADGVHIPKKECR